MPHVKFQRRYEVTNGTGNPPGPVFEKDGVYDLPADQADFWLRTGHAREATEAEALEVKLVEKKTDVDELDAMKSKDLISLAEREKIDLGDASKRTDIVARIREHRAKAPLDK